MMREFNFTTTPIVNIVNDIIIDSVVKNASDIHFDPAEKYLKIRIRIDGELRDYAIIDNKYKRNLTTRVKLLAGMNITESRLPQDGAIKSVIEGKDLDLRVSALPTSFGEKIVIRILDYSMSLQGIETLGFTEENYKIIMEMLASPNGIILITGATGSGKSTTVYSMLQRLNKEETNIITVEDPVEMSIEGLNQVQVNSEIGLDFAAVLRSILRQDPNVILIGEIRDSETAKIAVRASITGHLVLSTLHTNNSLTTIERLVDMEVERYLLSSSLKGIISQTLAKKLCPNCRVARPANETEKTLFKKVLGTDIETIYDAGRCEHCHNGYTGRIALQEVLMINDDIRDAINRNMDRDDLRHLIYKKGVKTLLQDGLIKVMQGITDLKEVFRLVDYDEYDNISEDVVEDTKEENEMDKLMHSIQQSQIENTNQTNQTTQQTQNVIAVPNTSNENKTQENQIIETANKETTPNMFDDSVFNNLRQEAKPQQAQPNTTNYTENLVGKINDKIEEEPKSTEEIQIPNASEIPTNQPPVEQQPIQPNMQMNPGMTQPQQMPNQQVPVNNMQPQQQMAMPNQMQQPMPQ